jgi:hypothetical protein
MRAVGFVMSLVLAVGCGGGASRQDACENVCGCFTFSDPSDGQACVRECVNASTSAQVELPSQACIDCAAEATCSGILNGTACAVECDDGSS